MKKIRLALLCSALLFGSSFAHAGAVKVNEATYDCTDSGNRTVVLTVGDQQRIEFLAQSIPPAQNVLGTGTLTAGSNSDALRLYYGDLQDKDGHPINALSFLRVTFTADGSVVAVDTVNNDILVDTYSNCTVDSGQ